MFGLKSPAEYGLEWITDQFITGFVSNLIIAFPILVGVSIGVYALVQMFSKRLASLGVVGVFLYGSLIIIA